VAESKSVYEVIQGGGGSLIYNLDQVKQEETTHSVHTTKVGRAGKLAGPHSSHEIQGALFCKHVASCLKRGSEEVLLSPKHVTLTN
jgi:hypothetical protein